MDNEAMTALRTRLREEDYQKLVKIDNPELHRFILGYVELCNPDKISVCSDSPEDIRYIRESAIRNGEEMELAIAGHTVHFDSYYDQARDKENTNILVPEGADLDPVIRTKGKDEGLKEIHEILENIMKGKELHICFFCLGPTGSEFSIPCVQLTDSSYVAHSETLLYRPGYEEFIKQGPQAQFFKFVHSQGELDDKNVCKNLDKRRIYIDISDDIVYSTNAQYGGNTIGLKKLAMRLAIKRGAEEDWLTEHMLILGVHGPGDRVTYFTGAFPSLCGKTSTAMLEGETIVGDDIAYIRKKSGEARAANVEKGMFGIIRDINSKDDPLLWKVLHSPGEVIVSNVLVTEDKQVHWIGKDGEVPPKGYNHSGEWWIGKKDSDGKEITCSHPNSRFTFDLHILDNADPKLDDPLGAAISGIVYGGRDSDTWVPVEEAFDWVHGIITKGASLESETTAATLGKEGVRKFNPMSNLDFLSIPIRKYIQKNLNFGRDLKNPPRIFSVNYFLRNREGGFLNEKSDKKIWYKWMELRVHNEVEAIETPTGWIPKYEDLRILFKEVFNRDYIREDYDEQFTTRVSNSLAKIERIKNIYETQVSDTPEIVFEVLEKQLRRLEKARKKYGDYITPDKLRSGNN